MPLNDFTSSFDDSYLGADLDLDFRERGFGGDLNFDAAKEDVKTIEGLDNLKKSLIRRIVTPRGSLSVLVYDINGLKEVNSNYGCEAYRYLSEPISSSVLNGIRTEIQLALEEEKRIKVTEITYYVQPETSGRIVVYYTINFELTGTQIAQSLTIKQVDGSFSF